MTSEPNQCTACGGVIVRPGEFYAGTLTVCRCLTYATNGTVFTVPNGGWTRAETQSDRIERKLDEILQLLRSRGVTE